MCPPPSPNYRAPYTTDYCRTEHGNLKVLHSKSDAGFSYDLRHKLG